MRSFRSIIAACLLLAYLVGGVVFGFGHRVLCIETSGETHVESLGGLCCENESHAEANHSEHAHHEHEASVQAADDTCVDIPLPGDHVPSIQSKVLASAAVALLPASGEQGNLTRPVLVGIRHLPVVVTGPSPHLATTVLRI